MGTRHNNIPVESIRLECRRGGRANAAKPARTALARGPIMKGGDTQKATEEKAFVGT